MSEKAMTCEGFEAILPDYFGGDLSDETKAAADAHAKTCAGCAKIVADIHRITAEAAALPPMRPSRDLWSGIEARISAPVIPLAQPGRRDVRPFASRWIAAAAAALVVTTAGLTYLATNRLGTNQTQQVAVLSPKVVTAGTDSGASTNALTPSAGASVTDKTPAQTTTLRGTIQNTRTPSATLASNDRTPRPTNAGPTFLSPQADAAYAEEIGVLEKIISLSKSGLDTATVAIVKKNLQVIDDAIAQSKAALAKDPASTLLYDQMTRAMSKKVDLLRTMASLSSST